MSKRIVKLVVLKCQQKLNSKRLQINVADISVILLKRVISLLTNPATNYLPRLTRYAHIKTAEQRIIIQQYSDWYTGRCWVMC